MARGDKEQKPKQRRTQRRRVPAKGPDGEEIAPPRLLAAEERRRDVPLPGKKSAKARLLQPSPAAPPALAPLFMRSLIARRAAAGDQGLPQADTGGSAGGAVAQVPAGAQPGGAGGRSRGGGSRA